MKPAQLIQYLKIALPEKWALIIPGKPGVGKSDIITQVVKELNYKLIISHPVTADPTDLKGLPFPDKDQKSANFLPFGDLKKLIDAKEPIAYFIDDFGQASTMVQASYMQLFLLRAINGHKISDHVRFIAATNGKADMSGVSGILEAVKGRTTIIELQTDIDDWCKWAISEGLPPKLIAFMRFKGADIINSAVPTKDIKNNPTPRTITNAARQEPKIGHLSDEMKTEIYKGCAGESFALQYMAFLKLFDKLPNIEEVFLNPTTADVPRDPDAKLAICIVIADKMTEVNIAACIQYLDRLPVEIAMACIKEATTRKKQLAKTEHFSNWAIRHGKDFL